MNNLPDKETIAKGWAQYDAELDRLESEVCGATLGEHKCLRPRGHRGCHVEAGIQKDGSQYGISWTLDESMPHKALMDSMYTINTKTCTPVDVSNLYEKEYLALASPEYAKTIPQAYRDGWMSYHLALNILLGLDETLTDEQKAVGRLVLDDQWAGYSRVNAEMERIRGEA